MIERLADSREAQSLASQLRKRRFALFTALLAAVPRPLTILDIGGTEGFWESMGFCDQPGISFVLVNLTETRPSRPNFVSVAGDATNLHQFQPRQFEVVFSNSVIEHVGEYEAQQRMAHEVRRVTKRYFVQTPNRHFPLEPHFLFPFFQFLPIGMRAALVFRFRLGWYGKDVTTREQARETVNSIRLLSRREMSELFPDAALFEEKFLGLAKSFIAYAGWEAAAS